MEAQLTTDQFILFINDSEIKYVDKVAQSIY